MTRTSTLLRLLVFTVLMSICSPALFAQFGVGIAVSFAPPELPVYEQPVCPGDGYIWTPGYWDWDDEGDDYYWVPGTWIIAPEVGFFWTPGYWGWGGGGYIFHQGYWGPEIGFYGGINYGYGYFGHGYEGGRWDNGRFFYNRSVNNVNTTVIHNVYNTTVVNNYQNTRVSYNGGQGGINQRPTSGEEAAAQQRHVPPVAAQTQHIQAARSNQELRASVNHGKPPVAATPKPADFHDRGAVAATNGGSYNPPPRSTNSSNRPPGSNNSAERPAASANPIHPKDVPPHTRPEVQSSGNANVDKKYQQQQEKLYKQQEKDHQKLQQQQDKEHQKLQQQQEKQQHNSAAQQDAARKQQAQQQMEQRHQQQTQQLEQKHAQQQQRLQPHPQPLPRQEAPPSHPSNPPKPPHNWSKSIPQLSEGGPTFALLLFCL